MWTATSSNQRQFTKSDTCRVARQWGHCRRCSVSQREMQRQQQSFEQCGHRWASCSFSMHMKHRNTSLIVLNSKTKSKLQKLPENHSYEPPGDAHFGLGKSCSLHLSLERQGQDVSPLNKIIADRFASRSERIKIFHLGTLVAFSTDTGRGRANPKPHGTVFISQKCDQIYTKKVHKENGTKLQILLLTGPDVSGPDLTTANGIVIA